VGPTRQRRRTDAGGSAAVLGPKERATYAALLAERPSGRSSDEDNSLWNLVATSPVTGKLIHEFQLRSQTSASIVAIERDGQSIINPGPDEKLQPGDKVPLLGDRPQLAAARAVLK
jgi:hypothetical protein